MTQDARFEDGEEQPIRLKALDQGDLKVISALLQDAVLPMRETSWQPDVNRFGLLVNRFRWEDKLNADAAKRSYERVQCMIIINNVQGVTSMGIDKSDADQIMSILSVRFDEEADNGGKVTFTLAGDGALTLDVECLELSIQDVTRPYKAVSGAVPKHDLG